MIIFVNGKYIDKMKKKKNFYIIFIILMYIFEFFSKNKYNICYIFCIKNKFNYI